MICAAITQSAINDVDNYQKDRNREYRDAGKYRSAAGWLIFVGVMGMLIESAIIIVRILNLSLVKTYFTIFAFIVSTH